MRSESNKFMIKIGIIQYNCVLCTPTRNILKIIHGIYYYYGYIGSMKLFWIFLCICIYQFCDNETQHGITQKGNFDSKLFVRVCAGFKGIFLWLSKNT